MQVLSRIFETIGQRIFSFSALRTRQRPRATSPGSARSKNGYRPRSDFRSDISGGAGVALGYLKCHIFWLNGGRSHD